MALDLERMFRHLESGDEDMAVLALRTFVKTRVEELDAGLRTRLRLLLTPMTAKGGDELRFFARQVLERLGESLVDLDASQPGQLTAETTRSLAAIEEIGARGGAEARRALVAMLRPDGDPWVLASVASALGKIGREEDRPALFPYLRHGDGRVRANCLEALGRLLGEDDALKMALHMSADPDPRVRTNALKAIARHDQARILDTVEAMSLDGAISTRAAAVHVLTQLGGPRVMAVLERLVEDEAEEVRLRVVDALANQQGLQAVRLLRRLVGDMDIDVAERALGVYERRKIEAGIQNSVVELDLSAFRATIEATRLPRRGGPTSSPDGAEVLDFGSVTGAAGSGPMPRIDLVGDEEPSDDPPVVARSSPSAGPSRTGSSPGEELSSSPALIPTEIEGDPSSPPPASPRPGIDAEGGARPGEDGSVAPSPEPGAGEGGGEVDAEALRATLDELDDRIDATLADVGRRIDAELRANRMQGGAHFDKLVYLLRRYETMLEKRSEAARKKGFWAKFVRSGDPTEDPGMVELEEALFEQYRRIGETAMGLAFQEGTRYLELEGDYERVEALLDEARRLKARGGSDGRQSE